MTALIAIVLLSWPSSPRDRPPPTWPHGAVVRAGAGDLPVFDQLLFVESTQRTPEQICVAGDAGRCVACAVGLIDGGTCSMQCVNQDGTSAGFVANEVGSTCATGPFPNTRLMYMLGTVPALYNDGGLLDRFSRDGGAIVQWGYSKGGPSGLDYWLDDNNATGCYLLRGESGAITWIWGASTAAYNSGVDPVPTPLRDGYGITVARYTAGQDAGSGPLATFVFNVNGGANHYYKVNSGTPGIDCGSPWWLGGRQAGDLSENGWLGGTTWFEGNQSNDWEAYVTESFYGMPSQRSAANRWVSTLALATGVDNTARTGNVDVMSGGGFLVSPEGIQGIDSQGTNWWATDALDVSSTVATGTGTLTTNVSSGPFAVYKNAPECDRLFDNDGTNFYCRWSKDAGVSGNTLWWNLSSFAKASDGGATTAKTHFVLQSDGTWANGGGHTSTCNFSSLGYLNDGGRTECRDKLTGGTYAIGGICVGNVGSDIGTIEICQAQFTNSPALEPPVVDMAARTAGFQTYAPWPASWPAFDAGTTVAVEVVTEIPYDPLGDWTTNTDVDYPFDVTQLGTYGLTDHATTVIFGYTTPGLELVANRDTSGAGALAEDFQIPGISFTRWHSVATRFEVSKRAANGIKCGSVVKQTDCGAQPPGLSPAQAMAWIVSCKARATIATNTDVDAGCPGIPGYITVTGRNNGSIVSTTKVKAIRLLEKP